MSLGLFNRQQGPAVRGAPALRMARLHEKYSFDVRLHRIAGEVPQDSAGQDAVPPPEGEPPSQADGVQDGGGEGG